jgi:nicotinamidase-related amidase
MDLVLLIIDMQVGLFTPEMPRYDAEGVIARINQISGAVRRAKGSVLFIQHDTPPGEELTPHTAGWQILPALERAPGELALRKTACDAFYRTDLEQELNRRNARRLIITGCATDFCVDTTLRAAASRDFDIFVAADAHTTADRPHLAADAIIRHHNYMWENLILPGNRVTVSPTAALIDALGL